MDIRKNSFKKSKKNVYKVDTKINNTKNINTFKRDKEERIQKENFFDRINFNFFIKNKQVLINIVVPIIVLILLTFSIIQLYKYVTKSDYFTLTEIQVSGNNYLTKDEIIEITKLQKNTNILNYRIKTIENNLLKSEWIQKVKIKRTLPNKYSIEVQERKPVFLVVNNQKLYYLDNKAQFITKVDNTRFLSLPVLYINNATNNEIKLLPEFINELETSKFPYALKQISWVSINELYGFELYIEESNLTLQIDIKNYEENIKNIIRVIEDLKKRKEIRKVRKIRSAFNKVMIIKE